MRLLTSQPAVPLLSLLTLTHFHHVVLADGQETIRSVDAYSLQRACAQLCFWSWNGGPVDNIGSVIGCAGVPALDSCYCRADQQSVGQQYLSSCIKSGCPTGGNVKIDISTAVGIYSNYCAGQGYTAEAVVVTTAAVTVAGTTSSAQAGSSVTTSSRAASSTGSAVVTVPTATGAVVAVGTNPTITSANSTAHTSAAATGSGFVAGSSPVATPYISAVFMGILMAEIPNFFSFGLWQPAMCVSHTHVYLGVPCTCFQKRLLVQCNLAEIPAICMVGTAVSPSWLLLEYRGRRKELSDGNHYWKPEFIQSPTPIAIVAIFGLFILGSVMTKQPTENQLIGPAAHQSIQDASQWDLTSKNLRRIPSILNLQTFIKEVKSFQKISLGFADKKKGRAQNF
ncbi:hypothetical protein G7Y89_g4817 [Cudoniella acicularis]|uniref:Extracellular membrane protein CFEM domain-containing protein n=1 Tax=Cudoniella acicularis TaxID=354080 RepID=A0A8H4W6A7_9HELO|nr:hypothetical protein G7Y89_g4817 [Cudoniella acicularis]